MIVRRRSIKQGDTTPLTVLCTANDAPAPLNEAGSIRVLASRAGVAILDAPATAGDIGEAIISSASVAILTAIPGIVRAEIEATWVNGTVTTFPADGYLVLDVVSDLG